MAKSKLNKHPKILPFVAESDDFSADSVSHSHADKYIARNGNHDGSHLASARIEHFAESVHKNGNKQTVKPGIRNTGGVNGRVDKNGHNGNNGHSSQNGHVIHVINEPVGIKQASNENRSAKESQQVVKLKNGKKKGGLNVDQLNGNFNLKNISAGRKLPSGSNKIKNSKYQPKGTSVGAGIDNVKLVNMKRELKVFLASGEAKIEESPVIIAMDKIALIKKFVSSGRILKSLNIKQKEYLTFYENLPDVDKKEELTGLYNVIGILNP